MAIIVQVMEPSDAAAEAEVADCIKKNFIGWFTAETLARLLSHDLRKRVATRYVVVVLEKMKKDRKLEAAGFGDSRCYRIKKERVE